MERGKDYWIYAGWGRGGAIALAAVLGVVLVVLGVLAVGASAAFPGRNGLIAFNAPLTDGILAMQPNGSHRHRLTRAGFAPAFSPDGREIVFTGAGGAGDTGPLEIMNADGSGRRTIHLSVTLPYCKVGTTCSRPLAVQLPSFSPDGSKIVFVASTVHGGSEIYTVNVDGSNLHQVTQRASAVNAVFSPDGKTIVFDGGLPSKIEAVNADGTHLRHVRGTHGGACPCSFSPNGKRLLFIGGRGAVFAVNIDGTRRHQLSHPSNRADFNPAFSPNGKLIVFAREGFGHGDIFVMNANGSNPHALARANPGYSEPAWQPLP